MPRALERENIPMTLAVGALTTFIKNHRDFWNVTCPDLSKALKVVNNGLRALPLRVPLGTENRAVAGPLGTAVDYYIGWMTGASLLDQTERMAKLNEDARLITGLVSARLVTLRNKARLSSPELENLGQLSLVLAHVESAFRTGNRLFIPPTAGLKHPKNRTTGDATFDAWLREQAPAGRVAEWLALAEQVRALPILWRGAIYNPVFGGYPPLITGSDGDLFTEGTLYDAKCSMDTFDGDAIRQLLTAS